MSDAAWSFDFCCRKRWNGNGRQFPPVSGAFGAPRCGSLTAAAATSTARPCSSTGDAGRWMFHCGNFRAWFAGFDGRDLRFGGNFFGMRGRFAFGCQRHRRNFGRLGGAKPGGAFLSFCFPIGAAETFRSGEIPFPGVHGISGSFKIASELEGNHGVARFGEQRNELSRRILAGTRSSNSCGDLLPVGHTVKAF